MAETIRFPFNRNGVGYTAEPSQIITLLNNKTGSLALGGEQAYTSIAAWKTVGAGTEAPYNCVAIEFRGTAAGIIGNGTTDLIGLFGQINLVNNPTSAAHRQRQLIAILGFNLGAALPQILVSQQVGPANDLVGGAMLVANVAAYDALAIGGVVANVPLPEVMALTVVARPIFKRDYLG